MNVELRPVAYGDLELLVRLLGPRDVWRNFGYHRAPSLFRLRLAVRSGDLVAFFIAREGEAEPAGFVLFFGWRGPHSSVEFCIAISDEEKRGHGLARQAVLEVERLMLGSGRCAELWAWMDSANTPVMELARAMDWPILEGKNPLREMVDGTAREVHIRLSRVQWEALVAAGKRPQSRA
jgi:RimJ/RimL family protein N-acetyltransferase